MLATPPHMKWQQPVTSNGRENWGGGGTYGFHTTVLNNHSSVWVWNQQVPEASQQFCGPFALFWHLSVNNTQRLQFINRNVQMNNTTKLVTKLLSKAFCTNNRIISKHNNHSNSYAIINSQHRCHQHLMCYYISTTKHPKQNSPLLWINWLTTL